jgi:dynein heavy chain 2
MISLNIQVMKEKPFYMQEDASQIKKMIQLKESLDQRMGCVIVGVHLYIFLF